MSEKNVDAWNRAIEAFNERDLEGIMAVLDSEVEFRPLLAGVMDAPYRGRQGVREWLANTEEAFEFFVLHSERLEDHGDYVLAIGEGHARGTTSGAEIRRPLVQIAEFRGGKCIWWQTFQSPEEALEAAGLSE